MLGHTHTLMGKPALALEQYEKAAALAALSWHLAFHGDSAEALEAADAALTIAEPLEEPRTVIRAFNTIAFVRENQGRPQEAIAASWIA